MLRCIICSLIVLAAAFVWTSTTVAETPEMVEEARSMKVLNSISAGDPEALLTVMQENWIPAESGKEEERTNRWSQVTQALTERHAGLEVVGVIADVPHQLMFQTTDPDGIFLTFVFDYESEEPHRILSMSVQAGEPESGINIPEFDLPKGVSLDEALAVFQEWFDDLADQDLFSGTALIAWNGEPIFSGAWGYASKEWSVENKIETRFDLGSINKSFTKIAVGQLINQGKLSLENTIAEIIPDYPNQETAARITVRHLLDHSSGLGDIFTEEFFRSSKSLYRGPRDFFPLFADQPLLFEPGERSQYSNAGFMVLGAVIEAISGVAYDEYVITNIFGPAGMSASGFFANDEIVPDVAVGYTKMVGEDGAQELRNNLLMLPVKGNSAGSAQSTVGDLLKFDNALREHRLLPPAYTNWYFGGAEPETAASNEDASKRVDVATGIAGGAPGVSAVLESDGSLAVIILSNYDSPITEAIARKLFRPLSTFLPSVISDN